jgi:exodeoxyribonuclease VII small subunit
MTQRKKETAELTFEEALRQLEEIVDKLEMGDLSLEESIELFERGQSLVAYCNDLLERASLKVEQLSADGEIIEIRVTE